MILLNSKYKEMCKCERFGSYNEFYSECIFCDVADECLYFKNIQGSCMFAGTEIFTEEICRD